MILRLYRRLIAPRPAFSRLRTRLAVRYATLFALAMVAVAGTAQLMIWSHARSSVRAAMTTSGQVYDRLWALQAGGLSDTADVLARDFGFRAAVATRDAPTIGSALANLRTRSRAPYAFLVEPDGDVIGRGAPALRVMAARVAADLPDGRRDAVVSAAGGVWRVVVSRVTAPMQIGTVVFALPLDAREMRALEGLSAIPLTAAVVVRDAQGGWRAPGRAGWLHDAALAGDRRDPVSIDTPEGRAFALLQPLPGLGARADAALLLSYPLGAALAPYRALQFGIAFAGVLGLLLVLHGSARLAGSLAAPITALERAAHALEEGARSEVEVSGTDEIARLAASFNRMSAGIIEREHRITQLAFHDTLTGLPNRTLFREGLELAAARAARGGGQVAVLCLDLDGFKGVNDTLGHPVGDALLRLVGEQLVQAIPDATVARLGGDEFAAILAGADADRARTFAQAVIDRLRAPIRADGHQIATGASIGIAIGPADGGDADTLLKNADLALYRAKQDGRGVFRYFEPALDAAARRRRQLELDLRQALTEGQFRLHFQPIYDLAHDRIGTFESLLRWEHPTRGMVSPGEFVGVAEETGLIVAIGEWVMREACRQAMRWPEAVRVAVNVSPLQFRNTGFAGVVMQSLAQSGLQPSRLEIEITESVFLDGEEPTVALLHRLRAMGVRVALDDFGTGYSSLSYLRSFPFDKIKIDKSFVDAVADDREAVAIVRAIVDLAAALRMETTAEGVERPEQLAALRAQGCGSIQGFVFSPPLPAEAASALLEDARSAAA